MEKESFPQFIHIMWISESGMVRMDRHCG